MAETAVMEKKVQVKESGIHKNLATYVSLTAAIIAALTGLSSLLMARHGGRATSLLIQSTNYWNYYQAKSLKSYILTSEQAMLKSMGKEQDAKAAAKLDDLEKEKAQIKSDAENAASDSKMQGYLSGLLGTAVTFFQIAIANAAIAALAKKPAFWYVALLLAAIGVGYFCYYAIVVNGAIH